jgi:hypothetical protein
MSRGSILVPVVSRETLSRLKVVLDGYEIIDKPLLLIDPDYIEIENALDNIAELEDHRIVSIFTSKNSVKVLLSYLYENGRLEDYKFIFQNVICIGPSTLKFFRREMDNYYSDFRPVVELIPARHNTGELIKLMDNIDGMPILWASKYVDDALREYVVGRGGLVTGLYEIILDRESLLDVIEWLREYDKIYFIFMSVKSLEAIRYLNDLVNLDMHGIFISERVYNAAEWKPFRVNYVYRRGNIEDFYLFIRGVVG